MRAYHFLVFLLWNTSLHVSCQPGVCYRAVATMQMYLTNTQVSYSQSYDCGIFGWSRCYRTRYSNVPVYRSHLVYHSERICCDGYSGNGEICSPICSNCVEPFVCVAPNVCTCPTGYFENGELCSPICSNCAEPFVCVAPNVCTCPTGYSENGELCSPICSNCAEPLVCVAPNVCTCPTGYFENGELCSPICGNCAKPFLCVAPYVCACPTGETGGNCTDPPQNVTLLATGNDSLELSWEPPQHTGSNVTVYIVILYHDADNETYHIHPEDNRTMELDSLTPHTTYTCCVIANTTHGPSSLACTTQTTFETVPSDPPVNVTVTVLNATAIKVEWSPPQTPNGNIVYYTIYININESTTSSNQSIVVNGLAAFRMVTVSVSANTKVGEGPVSEQQNVTTHESVPSAVENMLVVVLSDNLLHVSWEPPLSPNGIITGYIVTVTNLINTTESFSISLFSHTREHNISDGIEPYLPFNVSVSATTSVGAGESLQVTIFSREGAPQAPPQISTRRTEATKANIEWEELSQEDLRGVLVSYEVGYGSVGFTKCPVSDSYYNDTLSVKQERYAITDLDPGLQYCVWVAAKTNAGVGPFRHSLISWYTNNEFTVVLERPNCTQWISHNSVGKMEDLVRDISRGIAHFCRCTFQSNYITEGKLMCDEKVVNLVMFSGRLISTNDRNSSDLVLDLEKWVSSEPTALVQGEELQVVSSNTPSSDKPQDSSQKPPSSAKKQEGSSLSGIIAGTVAVVAVVVLVVIIVISVVVCYRLRRHNHPSVTLADHKNEKVTDRYTNYKSTISSTQGESYEVPVNTEKERQLESEVLANEDEYIYEVPKEIIDSSLADCTTISNPTYQNMTAGPVSDDDSNIYCEIQSEDDENIYEET